MSAVLSVRDWRVHRGGQQPVKDGTLVQVRDRGGKMHSGPAEAVDWTWVERWQPDPVREADIVRWRVVS